MHRPHDGTQKAEAAATRERGRIQRAERAEKKAAKDAEILAQIDPSDPIWKTVALERIKEDPAWWIRNCVYTSDQHDDGERIKKFPMDKGYFDFIIDALLKDKVVFAAKSSKILASWLGSALCVWKALFFEHSECYVQCLNEAAVDYFIQRRMKAIYDNLPDWQKKPGTSFRFCYMNIPANGSFVEGIPRGADKIRGRAPSLFVMDEVAFIDDAKKAVSAALPRILGDAMFLAISTPNMRNFFL